MIKDIFVNLTVGSPRDVAGDYAISVASAFQAHLSGVAFAYEPAVPAIFDGSAAALVDAYRSESKRAALDTRQQFEQAARAAGLTAQASVIQTGSVGAADTFGRMGRNYDLSIVGQAEPGRTQPDEMIIEAALFETGRPVLIVPYIQRTGLKLDRVMVCWDGSAHAARAIGDALPLLQRASAVNVVTIDVREHRNELSGVDIAQHLSRHGLKVELKPIVDPENEVADTILSYAADASSDLIVMGGYGHSRLRELVLGGATAGILAGMTVPTLMSH